MKLDYETIQFERQLKRATRLSLLEFAASERRRRRLSDVIKTRRSGAAVSPCEKAKKIVRNHLSFSSKKLHSTTKNSIIARRKIVRNVTARKIRMRRSSLKLRGSRLCADSQKYVGGAGSRFSRVNLDARLEIVWSDKVDGADSGFDDVPSAESSVDDTEKFNAKKLPQPSFRLVKGYTPPGTMSPRPDSYYRLIEKTPDELENEVEYDVDEEDLSWLKLFNDFRKRHKPRPQATLSVESFEMVMDRLEKEAHRQGQHIVSAPAATAPVVLDDDAICAICCDDECTNVNAILFCDSCNLAVHQECYGVPYVPEGQWICRRCQAGVPEDIACCMCPVLGGAVKQTNDGRWAHVVCALWIPEVGFGSIELLEPVTKLHRIPPARRRLTCVVCNKSHAGACIQCMHKNCYKAFHITCAQKVGLYMKIEPLLDSAGVMINVSKTLLCNDHKPPGARPFQPMIDNSIDNDGRPPAPPKEKSRGRGQGHPGRRRKDQKNASTADETGQSACNVPVIPPDRLDGFLDFLRKKDQRNVLSTLQSYWLLKRRSRNGLPLLRRLQVVMPPTVTTKSEGTSQSKTPVSDLMRVKKLRQEMEKVRLLLELIRKRERTKREVMRLHEMVVRLKLEPFAIHLHRTVDQLRTADAANVFGHPVTLEEAPDYLIHIKHPMDFSTMRGKIDAHEYKSFKDFETDFWHIVNNGKSYNADGSQYYKLAVQLGEKGKPVLAAARQTAIEAGYCTSTGLHALPPDADKEPLSPTEGRKRRDSSRAKEPLSPKSVCLPPISPTAAVSLPSLSPSAAESTDIAGASRKSPTRRRRISSLELLSVSCQLAAGPVESDKKPDVSPSKRSPQDEALSPRRRTRSSLSTETFEALPNKKVRKPKQLGAQSPRLQDDYDEPPELSRCPSPVDESAFPPLVSTIPLPMKSDPHDNSSDPPSLTLSSPDVILLPDELSRAGGTGVSETKHDLSPVDPRDFVTTRSGIRCVGSPDDTLDSLSSTESHAYSHCDWMMPTLSADYDSSYGSSCGRAGVVVSDSEATAGSCSSEAETGSEKADKMPILKNCDVC